MVLQKGGCIICYLNGTPRYGGQMLYSCDKCRSIRLLDDDRVEEYNKLSQSTNHFEIHCNWCGNVAKTNLINVCDSCLGDTHVHGKCIQCFFDGSGYKDAETYVYVCDSCIHENYAKEDCRILTKVNQPLIEIGECYICGIYYVQDDDNYLVKIRLCMFHIPK